MMVIRAIIENRSIRPIDPLPSQFEEGAEVEVSLVDDGALASSEERQVTPTRRAEIEAWFQELQDIGGMDDEDLALFEAAVHKDRQLAKEQARRVMEAES